MGREMDDVKEVTSMASQLINLWILRQGLLGEGRMFIKGLEKGPRNYRSG